MRGENIIISVLLMILSPIVIIFLMGAIGSSLGGTSSEVNILMVGIAILCDVVIGCTLIVLGTLNRLIRMKNNPQSEAENEIQRQVM
jgi:hypothetical protein